MVLAEQIKKIIASQMSRSDKRARADYIIDNSTTLQALYEQVHALHEEFLLELRSES